MNVSTLGWMLLGGVAAWFGLDVFTWWESRRTFRKVLAHLADPARPPVRLEPECLSVVHLTDAGVHCEHPDCRTERLAWDDLQRVEIFTTDDGPCAPDLFWVLSGTKGGCTYPQGATGGAVLSERLGQLPGFDHGAVIQAMGSTANTRFLCWQRTP